MNNVTIKPSPSAAARPRILIVDDHPVFRMALRQILPDADTVELDSFGACKDYLQTGAHADLVLLDLLMPDVEGFSALLYLRSYHPALRVAIVSGHEQVATIRRALDFGACAYLLKTLPLPALAQALRTVLAGSTWTPPLPAPAVDSEDRALAGRVAGLTPQQFRVLIALADGRLNKLIAHDLGVTVATIKFHVSAILRQLKLNGRTQAAVLAQRLKQVDTASSALLDSPDSTATKASTKD